MKSIRTISIGLCLSYVFLFLPAPARGQFTATPFSDPATGERYHIEAAGALWNPPPQLEVASEEFGIAGTKINAVTDLGIQRN
jgi:hypothetical protein